MLTTVRVGQLPAIVMVAPGISASVQRLGVTWQTFPVFSRNSKTWKRLNFDITASTLLILDLYTPSSSTQSNCHVDECCLVAKPCLITFRDENVSSCDTKYCKISLHCVIL